MLQIENIPEWLRENGHFVLRRGKIPYTRYGRRADPTNAADGCTAAEAIAAWGKTPDLFDGIGVMIMPPLVGIDLDHVISENGELTPTAAEILGMADTYAEVSPSGTGLHLLGLAPGMESDSRYLTKNSDVGVEVYFGNRYFTFTGNGYAGGEIREIGAAVQEILDTYMRRSQISTEGRDEGTAALSADIRTEEEIALDAEAVMERMRRGTDWSIIEAQLSGEILDDAGDVSADDMSLMNRLAFYSGRDARVMDYIYRVSDRYRDKWDERRGEMTYGAITIRNAVRMCRNVWDPNFDSKLGTDELHAFAWLTDQKAEQNRRYSLDDIGAGYLLADWAKPFARFCADANSWFVYRDGAWKKDSGGVAIAAKAKVLSSAIARYAASITDDQRRKAWLSFAGRWCSYTSRKNYVRDAASVWPIQRSDFDRHPWLFNVVNGTLDLHEMTFRPHDPEDMLTKQGSVVYNYQAWCRENGNFAEAKNRFLAGLRNRGVQMDRQRPSTGGEKTTVIIGRENRIPQFGDLSA